LLEGFYRDSLVLWSKMMEYVQECIDHNPKYPIYGDDNLWYKSATIDNGVYIVRNLEDEIVYVGETSSIRERMGDL